MKIEVASNKKDKLAISFHVSVKEIHDGTLQEAAILFSPSNFSDRIDARHVVRCSENRLWNIKLQGAGAGGLGGGGMGGEGGLFFTRVSVNNFNKLKNPFIRIQSSALHSRRLFP